jgi:hypothetical protein
VKLTMIREENRFNLERPTPPSPASVGATSGTFIAHMCETGQHVRCYSEICTCSCHDTDYSAYGNGWYDSIYGGCD